MAVLDENFAQCAELYRSSPTTSNYGDLENAMLSLQCIRTRSEEELQVLLKSATVDSWAQILRTFAEAEEPKRKSMLAGRPMVPIQNV
jgi:hypothetical protein